MQNLICNMLFKTNWMMRNRICHVWMLGVLLLAGCSMSCSRQDRLATYLVTAEKDGAICLPLLDWNVCGAFSPSQDSLLTDSFVQHPYALSQVINPDTTEHYWYNDFYHPLYNQLDLREVFQIEPEDTTHTLKGKVVYFHCDIRTEKDTNLYVEVKKSMKCYQFLNGDTLHRREIQGLNIYPIHLKAGVNTYLVKAIVRDEDYSFEATLYDSLSVARLYADGQSCNLIYPQIENNVIMLTNAHQRVMDVPVTLQFHDVEGREIGESLTLLPDSFTYHVPELQKNVSYMCSMTMCGATIRQPVLCGNEDDAYARFVALRQTLPDNHPRVPEIDGLLYRLGFLLQHPTRYEGDWWWQFKISPLTYQLEHTFAHLDDTYGKDDTEANIQFITYRSEQDDSLQRYLLARPNKIRKDEPLPLVVVIRPNIENPHPFFSSPQMARQWALNLMQAGANRHHCLIMMPEMRTYLSEDISLEAEREMKLAIKDVQQHYPVDANRMYLHANCSGGYRALRIATENPDMFSAIGLYAPTYHCNFESEWSKARAPQKMIGKLRGIPMFIHYDPLDGHSPYESFADLVTDCKKESIPLTLSVKRNSGQFYNVVLVGEEALDFFNEQNQ